jgi:NAD(P)-dependent dehydrogenase (short-subunit alcohol dehydrogenase family)
MTSFSPEALTGRTAVVTGSSGGLGGAIVEQLASMGANVVSLDLKADVAMVSERHLSIACDIGRESQVAAAADAVFTRFGRCDILINNAAILPAPVKLEDLDEALWDQVMSVNLKGAFLCAKHFGKLMIRAGSGSIVNLASIAAVSPNAVGVYGPSKAAVSALTRQIAVEWGKHGVRANTVSPGLVRTPMSETFYAKPENHAARTAVVASRRIGVPEDVASVIGFLASDASAYVNGQEIFVDGGFLQTALMNVQQRS